MLFVVTSANLPPRLLRFSQGAGVGTLGTRRLKESRQGCVDDTSAPATRELSHK